MAKVYTDEELQEAVDWVAVCNGVRPAARESGIPRNTLAHRYSRALEFNIMPSGRDPRHESLTPIQAQHCAERGIPASQLRHGWDKDAESGRSYFFKVPHPDQDPEALQEAMLAAAEMMTARAKIKLKKPPVGQHMLVLAPADIHLGKLADAMECGKHYDVEEAERRTKEGVLATISMSKGFGIEKIIVNTGNDSQHTDNGKTTTRGTPQDTDGTWHSTWLAAFNTWVWVIEEAAKHAPVSVVFTPSNHPWRSDWSMNMALAAYFRNVDHIDFPNDMQTPRHRKYVVYGSSLIGFTHGDGAKDADLAHLMAFETGVHFGEAMRGYWIVGHLHHKVKKTIGLSPALVEKDLIGLTVMRPGDEDMERNVSVEVVRSPSEADGWHDRNAYVGALKAVEAFIFHSRDGQIARFTKPFW